MNRRTQLLAVAGLAAALGLLVGIASAAGASSKATAPHFKSPHFAFQATLVIRSDGQHGKKGADGKWHDAFLPANFTVLAGVPVKVTVYNYDDMPHSFTSSALHLNKIIAKGGTSTPSKTTFTFTPTEAGRYLWWCAPPCDPYSMSHIGYMRGYVTAIA